MVNIRLCSQMKNIFFIPDDLLEDQRNEQLWDFCQFVSQAPSKTNTLQENVAIFKYALEKVEKNRKSSGLSVFVHLSDKQTFDQLTSQIMRPKGEFP